MQNLNTCDLRGNCYSSSIPKCLHGDRNSECACSLFSDETESICLEGDFAKKCDWCGITNQCKDKGECECDEIEGKTMCSSAIYGDKCEWCTRAEKCSSDCCLLSQSSTECYKESSCIWCTDFSCRGTNKGCSGI